MLLGTTARKMSCPGMGLEKGCSYLGATLTHMVLSVSWPGSRQEQCHIPDLLRIWVRRVT